jgi:3',5'-cyclic AMP phosphodiesterase CpdA
MRRLAHISDLHFGRIQGDAVEALLADLHALRPNLVVVSGDLTQRARRVEFLEAQAFLARLQAPVLVVPGNHDIPLYDVVRRALAPLARYRRFIHEDLAPRYDDDEIAVAGINTARAFAVQNGRVSLPALAAIQAAWSERPDDVVRIVVSHHPFVRPAQHPQAPLVGRAGPALEVLERARVDLVLSGHLHASWSGEAAGDAAAQPAARRSILVVQAGTATSARTRGEANGFNVIDIAGKRVDIAVRALEGARFVPVGRVAWAKEDGRWRAVPELPFLDVTAP